MLKPLEEKGGVSGVHIAKIVFVLAIIVAGLLMSTNGPDPKKMSSKRQSSVFNPQVLGATVSRGLLSLVPKAKLVKDETVKKVQSFFGEKKEKVGKNAQQFFYSNAVHPILQQIDKLPKDDQEKIRKELCKPE